MAEEQEQLRQHWQELAEQLAWSLSSKRRNRRRRRFPQKKPRQAALNRLAQTGRNRQ
jgi:hypothetical protein